MPSDKRRKQTTPKRRARIDPDNGLQRFREIVASDFGRRIDVEKRVVYDVAMLGAISQNGRRYSESALRDAAKVFEGSKVYLNHRETDGRRVKPHPVQDYVGRLSGLELVDGKVRAQRFEVVNQQHWPLVAAAQRDPDAFGFSIDGEGEVVKGEVTTIRKAHSVDLVSDPATLRGLFEEHLAEPDVAAKPKGTQVQALIFSKQQYDKTQARAWAKDHGFRSSGIEETEDSWRIRQFNPSRFKRMRTKQLRPGVKAVVGFTEQRKRGAEMDWDKVTRKELEENVGDLIDELREEHEAESGKVVEVLEKERDELKVKLAEQEKPDDGKKTLQEQVEALQVELAASTRREQVAAALRDTKIVDPPEALQEALARCEKPEQMTALCEAFVQAWQDRSGKPRSFSKDDPKAPDEKGIREDIKRSWKGSRPSY